MPVCHRRPTGGASPTRVAAAWLPLVLVLAVTGAQPSAAQVKPKTSAGAADPALLAPRIVDFRLNGGGYITSLRTVRLEHQVLGNPVYYRAGEQPQLAGAEWRLYRESPTYELSPSNGPKVVYFQVRTEAAASEIVAAQIALSNPLVTSLRVMSPAGNESAIGQIVPSVDNLVSAFLEYSIEGQFTECQASTHASFAGAPWLPCVVGGPTHTTVGLPFDPPGRRVVYLRARGPAGVSNVVADTIDVEHMTFTQVSTGWAGGHSGYPTVPATCPGGGRVKGITADMIERNLVQRFYGACTDITLRVDWTAGHTRLSASWGTEDDAFHAKAPLPAPITLQDIVRALSPGAMKFEFFNDYRECAGDTWVEGVTAHLDKLDGSTILVGLSMRCTSIDGRGGRTGSRLGMQVTGLLTQEKVDLVCPDYGLVNGITVAADWTIRGIQLHCLVPNR
ncbi:MAG: hypothetical protein KC645_06440 [Gemmatimonadetes bacterium]|nr:hypothetical protein [Gemmatimonadota bacterium]